MKKHRKIFVVSDIHGHYTLLYNALTKAGFDKDNENHLLVCCGDYFDRGSESAEVMKFLERLKNKVLIRGNHEDLLLSMLNTGKVLAHNYINGSLATLKSFFGKYSIDPIDDTIDFSGKTRTVDRICEFIGETVNYFETENYVFVHGWLPANARNSATDEDWKAARWIKWTDKYDGKRPLAEKTLVCGHMPTFYANKFDPQRNQNCADIFSQNGLIAIDAGTFDTEQINVLVIEDNLI